MRSTLQSGLTLSLGALAAMLALAATSMITREPIERSKAQTTRLQFEALLPADMLEHDPLASMKWVTASELGTSEAVPVYPVFKQDKPVAVVLSVVAPDGYNGSIHLLVSVDTEGTILGVRVTDHRETPGLGDDIEHRRSDWINSFAGRSLQSTTAGDWTVVRQGGQFDSFTGATVTPKAVINAVYRALSWYSTNQEAVFER